MIPAELIKNIRRIQIRTSHLVDDLLGGQYHSAFKGRGIEFEEVRPYQVGDDVRAIDWNVTARTGRPHIKLFREERELTVILLVDVSSSQGMGTHWQTKRELVTELGATLAFSAIKNNDKVGLSLFSDQIEKVVPPKKGARHVLRVIRELLYCRQLGKGTNLTLALEHLLRVAKRRAVVFLISDFQDRDYLPPLRVVRRKHDLIPIVVGDRHEGRMPDVGLLQLWDAESGCVAWLDTSSPRQRRRFAAAAAHEAGQRDEQLRRLGLDPIHVTTGEDWVRPLQRFFQRRETRR